MGFDEISSHSTQITKKSLKQPKKSQKTNEPSNDEKALNEQNQDQNGLQKQKILKNAEQNYKKAIKQIEEAPAAPGPQSYKIKHDYVEKKPSGYSFGKGQRDAELKLGKKNQIEKTDNRLILYPSIDAARPSYHGSKAVWKLPVAKPELKNKEQFTPSKSTISEAETRVSSGEKEYNKRYKGTAITIAPLKYQKLTDLELERVIRAELQKFPHLIKKKVYQMNTQKNLYKIVDKNVHGVKIVNKKTERRMQLEKDLEQWRRPTMFTYSPDDRKVKDQPPMFTFKQSKKERTPSPDRRRALYVSLKLTKKSVPQVAILPEHQITDTELIKEFEQTRLGPTSYKPEYGITEKRADIGIVKIKEPIHVINEEDLEDDRPALDINYDYNKPGKLVFQYHEPSKDIGPQHTPEKVLNPGKWKFYDYDLDVVREEVGKEITFARNLNPDDFKQKEEFYQMLVEHNKRQEKRPGVGQYEPREIETKIEVDFSKARGREDFIDPEYLKEQDIEGDVLILDPDKPQKRMPNIKFDKQIGREEEKVQLEDINMHEELILEPNIDIVKKRKVNFVDFDKQIGREEKKHIDDDEYYVNNLEYKEMIDPSQKKVVVHDFGKQEERFKVDMRRELGIEPDELIIDNKLPDKNIKGYVKMDRGEERFPEKLASKDPFYEELPISDLNIDVDKAIQATKPNVSVVDFNRYPKTKEKEQLDLKIVKEKQEEEKKQHIDKKNQNKNTYNVGKIFPQRAQNQKKKNTNAVQQKPKKKEMNADAEIEQYMKELGLS